MQTVISCMKRYTLDECVGVLVLRGPVHSYPPHKDSFTKHSSATTTTNCAILLLWLTGMSLILLLFFFCFFRMFTIDNWMGDAQTQCIYHFEPSLITDLEKKNFPFSPTFFLT